MTIADPSSGAADPGRMRVGFLHVGRDRSGVRRYGRILAQAAVRRDDITVTEADGGDRGASWRRLRSAARDLADTDVVHLQWKLADWDPRLGGIPRMEVALSALPRPVVMTLHDVLPRRGLRERWLSRGALGLRLVGRAADALVVHAEEERIRLDGLVPAEKVAVIPHFVEDRPSRPGRDDARTRLDVGGRRVITLLGAMTKRRGHRLVLEALRHLPDDVLALFVGAPIAGRDQIETDLRRAAADLGVAGRVRFLGYVDDDALEDVLAATDVGLCPFREMSASGALATWISSGRPIVVTDLPAIAGIVAMTPGALETFTPYRPEPLATGIEAALARATAEPDARVTSLATALATGRIVDRYVRLYREVIDRRHRPGRRSEQV